MDYSILGKEPIPGDKPTGNDCRYEESFETLQAEIDKMSSPTASGNVDWSKIVELSSNILLEQSKDLTVAGYLAVGLVQTRKLDGLDEGVRILKDLVDNYWDKLYPSKKRMRGRAGALEWWVEKTQEALGKFDPKPIPVNQAEQLQENLKTLHEQLVENMPEPPLMRPLQREIEKLPTQKVEVEEPKAESADAPIKNETKAPPVQPTPSSKAEPRKARAVDSEKDALKNIDTAIQIIREASSFLIDQDLKNSSAYRYRRIATWMKINMLPPNDDGVTKIPSPASQVMTALTDLHDQGNWAALVSGAESKVSQFVFWLDLSYMVVQGLKQLGSEYQDALSAVNEETAHFLIRLPGIETFSFSDGTPFADTNTQKWLKSISSGRAGGKTTPDTSSDEEDQFSEIIQKALSMGRKKKLVQAIDMLQQKMNTTSSRSHKMRWRLGIAQVLMAAKKSQLAMPHLDKILSEIDTFKLEEWDPSIALEGLIAAWNGYNNQSSNDKKVHAVEILDRIAKIDPAQALKMAK